MASQSGIVLVPHRRDGNYRLSACPGQVKMQLDVDMSQPDNEITFRLGLIYLTFDLDLC